jgi:hypothetical protein
VSFPEFPGSRLVYEANVAALSATEWSTTLTVTGTYNAPTDVVSVKDYEMTWTSDGRTLNEQGRATLVLSSGKSMRSEWSSTITTSEQGLRAFPAAGEVVRVSISPFKVEGNRMSYEWRGSVGLRR